VNLLNRNENHTLQDKPLNKCDNKFNNTEKYISLKYENNNKKEKISSEIQINKNNNKININTKDLEDFYINKLNERIVKKGLGIIDELEMDRFRIQYLSNYLNIKKEKEGFSSGSIHSILNKNYNQRKRTQIIEKNMHSRLNGK